MKIDMLEVKKDRVKEIDKQIRELYKYKNNYFRINILKAEKEQLLGEVKEIESKRGE